ncbi:metal-dependent transcriptional regulator [candidate division KSB1 bacterium]|nr:metal-dependent transcriptional regulator [candidate division KSB1 bacterium]NIR68759.1 metal-dependent transcriptional regulator [candidate division KSB1 bacterium]NIS25575.1 metal-dependent transcriptional regulator [candidate division KSB1 bacterium]NIT72469.1 metal-dependent transcriptional regulator [candidate division KSB1 bacterium]NIU26253.1 metal-dependent transcriptional regulator [candidate division KSB1 bacterium]
MITQTVQDYLKIIYKLGSKGETVTTNAIAERLNVSQASVTGMIKKLAELKLVTHTPYRGVELTQAGRKIALEIIRHHRLLELYLAQALGYSWDEVHDEAEKLEHVISEDFETRMAEALGNPTTDPHGAPIPSKDGEIVERSLVPLTQAKAGQRVTIEQVSDSDPTMLRYLGDLGIYPKVEIDVLEKAPFDGPLLIQLGDNQHHLGETVTDNILVSAVR